MLKTYFFNSTDSLSQKITSDVSKLEHPEYPDLVNNEYLFNSYYSSKKIDVTQTWSDDSDYSFYPHIDDIIDELVENPTKYKDITVRVNSEYIYSSAKQRGGFDRPLDLLTNGGYEKATESLRIKNDLGQERGFISADCPTMNGFVRWTYNEQGGVTGITIVKNMGNHRFILKKRAAGGNRVEMLIKLHFHPVEPKQTLNEMIRRESDSHHTDAQDQRGQTEEQKAYSGFKSGRKEYIDLVNFLKEVQVDYADILKQEKLLLEEKTPKVTNIGHMNGGINSGIFKKLGIDNVRWAFKTAREIALHPTQEPCQLSISHSSIMCFTNLYYYFTERFQNQADPLFSKEELHKFLIAKFTTSHDWEDPMKLINLNQTSGQKDYNVINAINFVKSLRNYYQKKKTTKTGDPRKYAFGMEKPAVQAFFNSITDPLSKKFAISESGIV
jgi:hypothetical protein